MATTVRITETYDMKTTVGKMGLVGIHTPQVTQIRKMYPGLLKNHKFIRFMKCEVVGACASVLPADPLQVGVEAGDVAPEDMFNPILYTAVSNESFDTIVARIRQLSAVNNLGSVDGGDAWDVNTQVSSNFACYYGLLAENGKFRKVMPQSGFNIKNLVPLCHTVISTYGNVGPQGNNMVLSEDGETPIAEPDMSLPGVNASGQIVKDTTTFFKGRAVKMPKFPIHTSTESQADIPYPVVPKTHVLAMILPPARLHEFWYRMRVSWTVRFENVCSTMEAGNFSALLDVGNNSYARNYAQAKNELAKSEDMVDVTDVQINKVMES